MQMTSYEKENYIEWIEQEFNLDEKYGFIYEDDLIDFKFIENPTAKQERDLETTQWKVTEFYNSMKDEWLQEERDQQGMQEDIERTQESDWAGSRGC